MDNTPRIDTQPLSLIDLHRLIPATHRSEIPSTPKSLPTECQTGDLMPSQYAEYMLRLVMAYCRAMKDSLALYRPLPTAELFHASLAHQRLLVGSNQSGKAQPIDELVLTPDGWRCIGDLAVGDLVIGGDGQPTCVIGVFPQGEKEVFRVVFDDGAEARCCGEHLWRVVDPNHRFGANRRNERFSVMSLNEIIRRWGEEPDPGNRVGIQTCVAEMAYRDVPLDPYVLGVLLGDGCTRHQQVSFSTADAGILESIAAGIPKSCRLHHKGDSYDYQVYGNEHGKNELLNISRELGLQGKLAHEKFIPDLYLHNSVEVRLAVLQGLMDTDGSISKTGTVEFCTTSPRLAADVTHLVRSLGGKCKAKWRITSYTYGGKKKNGRPSARVRVRMKDFNPFRLERKAERFKPAVSTSDLRLLYRIEPAGKAECVCIAVENSERTYVTRDCIVTHNTLTAMAEFARIIRGLDPFKKLPAGNLRTMSVGIDQDYLGQVLWKKLWFPGAFEIVPDEVDGFWRAVRPDPLNPKTVDPIDAARMAEWRPAPPLLPGDEIAKVNYEKAGEGVPSLVIMRNGTESLFCTSRGNPRQGIQLNFVNFSEELLSTKWLGDAMARLVRYGGSFMWDCTPENSTPQLYDLHKRVLNGDPDVEEFKLLIENNPYFTEDSKRRLYNDLAALGADTLAVKWHGEYAIAGRSAYPMYNLDDHGIEPYAIPHDWMVCVAIDPGSRAQGAVFGAVPPDASRLEIFGALVVKNQNAYAFAKELKRIVGWRRLEVKVIDKKGSDPRSPGRDNTIADHYMKEFERAGLLPARLMGHGFVHGSSDCEARELSVKAMFSSGELKLHKTASVMMLDHQLKNRFYDKNNPHRRETRTEHELPDCYDDQTEVLSDAGWKNFKDLSGAESLATVNLATDTLEFQMPSRLIAKPYVGDMIKIGGGGGQRLDMLVTPKHRMVVMRCRHTTNEVRPADTLATSDRIKTAVANWAGKDFDCPFQGVDIGDFAEFLGWYVAEGCVKKPRLPGHGYGTVMSQVKPEGCERLEWLFSRLPFKWFKIKGGYQSSSNKVLWNLLAPLGNKYTKRVPEWIKSARQSIIRRFLDGAVAGDGWTIANGAECYATVSRGLADDIQELFIKTGRAVAMRSRDPQPCAIRGGLSTNTVTQYHLHARITKQCSVSTRDADNAVVPIFSRVHYDGMVYCATVPNGTLVVRRNGKVAVCGNCLEYLVAYFDGGLYYHAPHPAQAEERRYDRVVADKIAEIVGGKKKKKRRVVGFAG